MATLLRHLNFVLKRNAFVMPARQRSYNSRHQFRYLIFDFNQCYSLPIRLSINSRGAILCKQIRGEGLVQAHHDVAELHERRTPYHAQHPYTNRILHGLEAIFR